MKLMPTQLPEFILPQLAFESLAVISNALTLLEVGELSICSFGESVKLLHPFHEQFTNQSGSKLLQQFTFEQKKTKIAQVMYNKIILLVNCCFFPCNIRYVSRRDSVKCELSHFGMKAVLCVYRKRRHYANCLNSYLKEVHVIF